MRRLRLTLWEVVEIDMKDIYLLIAVCDMGVMGLCFHVVFDKRTHKEYHWLSNVRSRTKDSASHVHIAKNLLNGNKTYCDAASVQICFENAFEKGEAQITDYHKNSENGVISGSFHLKKLAPPSIVSIPFGKNRPLYTEKAIFTAEGSVSFNGETFTTDANTVAIIDDHRGYYPRTMHYDWITFMGKDKFHQYLGLNLTRNQSLDQVKYNENLLWRKETFSVLPPVIFRKTGNIATFRNEKETPVTWRIQDDYGMVNLEVTMQSVFHLHKHVGFKVLTIDYDIFYGVLKGFIRDENGNIIDMTGLEILGEDKSMAL